MIRNPKSTKQEIKLWAFHLIDIGIVAGLVMIASNVVKLFPINGTMTMFYYILTICFGIFLCMRTPSHPTERNYIVLFNLLKMDRNKYHSIEF